MRTPFEICMRHACKHGEATLSFSGVILSNDILSSHWLSYITQETAMPMGVIAAAVQIEIEGIHARIRINVPKVLL